MDAGITRRIAKYRRKLEHYRLEGNKHEVERYERLIAELEPVPERKLPVERHAPKHETVTAPAPVAAVEEKIEPKPVRRGPGRPPKKDN